MTTENRDNNQLEERPAFIGEGQAHLAVHDYEAAIRVLRLGLLKRPTSVEGRIVLCRALLILRRYHEIITEMRVALQIAPENAQCHLFQAEAYLGLGEYNRARKALTQVLARDPEHDRAIALIDHLRANSSEIDSQRSKNAEPQGGLDPSPTFATKHYPRSSSEQDKGDSHIATAVVDPRYADSLLKRIASDTATVAFQDAEITRDAHLGAVTADEDDDGDLVRAGTTVSLSPLSRSRSERTDFPHDMPPLPPDADEGNAPAHLFQESRSTRSAVEDLSTPKYLEDYPPDDPAQDPLDSVRTAAIESQILSGSEESKPHTSGSTPLGAQGGSQSEVPAHGSEANISPVLPREGTVQLSDPGWGGADEQDPVAKRNETRPIRSDAPSGSKTPRDRPRPSAERHRSYSQNDSWRSRLSVDDRSLQHSAGTSGGRSHLPPQPSAQRWAVQEPTTFLSLILGGQRNHGWLIVSGGVIGIVVIALVIGFFVRAFRSDRSIEEQRNTALLMLRHGNLPDFREAERLARRLSLLATSSQEDRLLLARVRAARAFEFGEPYDLKQSVSPVEHAGSGRAAALTVYDRLQRGDLAAVQSVLSAARAKYPKSGLLSYLQGRISLLEGKFFAAEADLRRADELSRGDVLTIKNLGDALAAMGKLGGALREYDRALAFNSAHVASLLAKVDVFIKQREVGRAKKILKRVRSLKSSDGSRVASRSEWAHAAILEGRLLAYDGHMTDARARYTEASGTLSELRTPRLIDELAALMIDGYQLQEAAALIDQGEKLFPGRYASRKLKIQLALALGQPARAEKLIAESADPRIFPLLRVETLMALSRIDEAALALAEVDDRSDTTLVAVEISRIKISRLKAKLIEAQGDRAAAIALLRTILLRHPNKPKARLDIARLLAISGRTDEARSEIDKALRGGVNLIAARLLLADILLMESKYDEAGEALAELLEAYPTLYAASLRFAHLYIGQADFKKARAQLETSLKVLPEDINARRILIDLLMAQQDYSAAARELTHVSGAAPGINRLIRGKIALAKNDLSRAKTNLMEAKKLLIGNIKVRTLLIEAYLRDNKLQLARKVFREVQTKFPGRSETAEALGRIELDSANAAKAALQFTRASTLLRAQTHYPADEARLLVLIGRAHQEAGHGIDKSLDYYRRAVIICPLCAQARFRQGLALDESGRTESAIAALKEAIELAPRTPEPYYELAKIYQGKGQSQAAIQTYEKYLARDPAEEFSISVRRTIEELRRE